MEDKKLLTDKIEEANKIIAEENAKMQFLFQEEYKKLCSKTGFQFNPVFEMRQNGIIVKYEIIPFNTL